MKLKLFIVFLLFFSYNTFSQPEFQKYFIDASLRFDFLMGGNENEICIFPQQMKKEPYWGGTKTRLTEDFDYGSCRYQVFDYDSETLIFSKGFGNLFQEWQSTSEAEEINKAYYHAAIFPFPKNNVILKIDIRQWDGSFITVFETEIDPDDYWINSEISDNYEKIKILDNGEAENKVDIVFLAEGYTEKEMDKFIRDTKNLSEALFQSTPFNNKKNLFNIYAILTPSIESGTDIPGDGIYKNTFFNSTFYTFDVSRYLTTSDMKKIHDAAAVVPYDQLCMLVNTDEYGGGGFYNFLNVCVSDNENANNIFIHEFGHSFAGLGDEYYDSEVAFEDFYNLEIEPWEPNLTTLVDFDKKWGHLIDKTTPVPTPRIIKNSNLVGVYEGGGYSEKGIYSPMMDCRMKSNDTNSFCPVCTEAILRMIEYYTD